MRGPHFMLLSCWNRSKEREKEEKGLSGSVSTVAVGCSSTTGWEPGAACWKRAHKVLLNLCKYMNLEQVILRVCFKTSPWGSWGTSPVKTRVKKQRSPKKALLRGTGNAISGSRHW